MVVDTHSITTLLSRLSQAYPQPVCGLVYNDAYTLLVAVVLSAQSTDVGVNQVTPGLFSLADTPQKMWHLPLEQVQSAICRIGLYRRKAQYIKDLSGQLVQFHGGCVPSELSALEVLPGVGRKTANVVLNVYFGQPTIPVDTHVLRVSKRLGLTQKSCPKKVEEDLHHLLPPAFKKDIHAWLITHGRQICKARNPLCSQCFLKDLCPFFQASL